AISVDIKANYKDEKRNKSWENVTLKDIVSEITSKANKSLIYEVENIIKYKRVDQSLESDLQLLKRLCEQEGLSLKSAVDKLIVFNKEKYEKEDALGIIELTPYLNFTIDSDDADTYDSCIIEYYDPTLKETLRGEFKAPEREGYKENTNRILRVKENNSVPGESKEEKEAFLTKKAKSKLRSKNSNETKVNISNRKGDFITWAGSTVTLVNFGVYSGKYVVNKITRTIGDSGYKQSLELNKTLEY
ncbi:MAG: phage late control D family protein, partial [Cetobacterium sp.]